MRTENLSGFGFSQATPHTIHRPRTRLHLSPNRRSHCLSFKYDRQQECWAFFSHSHEGTIRTPTLGWATKSGSAAACLQWCVNSPPGIRAKQEYLWGSFQLCDSQGFVHSFVPTTLNQTLQEANTSWAHNPNTLPRQDARDLKHMSISSWTRSGPSAR